MINTPGTGEATPPSRGRLLIGGLRGSSGKTVITLGIIGSLRRRGISVTAFKKGPDYIDAAWHTLATGAPCYCLDVFMAGAAKTARQFASKMPAAGIAVIEGNRGLFDGVDEKGSFSTAELAKLLDSPLLLVVDATKVTRTTAAMVLGCRTLDPELKIAGVVLNQVAGKRHQDIATRAIEEITGIPVLGAAPKLKKVQARERHLGLVTPEETPEAERWVFQVAEEVGPYLDMDRIVEAAYSAGAFEPPAAGPEPGYRAAREVRIGVIRDSAFPFYYAENLEALERAGAWLVWIRAVDDPELPEVDALYIGGGFPETHGKVLAGNRRFRQSIRAAVEKGLPVYAECGGAIYLGRRLYYQGGEHEMVGVVPLDFEFCPRPQGHGYTAWRIDRENPFYRAGTEVRGHEFHYTRVRGFDPDRAVTVAQVIRGEGFGARREGVMVKNVVAFYGHVHALGCPEWTEGLVRAAERYAGART
jgi:cobyrinic acid a,c-diamide synthase